MARVDHLIALGIRNNRCFSVQGLLFKLNIGLAAGEIGSMGKVNIRPFSTGSNDRIPEWDIALTKLDMLGRLFSFMASAIMLLASWWLSARL
jgi:hypothetical protein